jgi:predicted RND superfamily exporter protein
VRAERTNLLGSSTARAIVYSALTTVASFGTMAFASRLGLATLGQMLSLGVGFTVLSNVVVLPALISLREERRRALPQDPRAPLREA